MSNGFGFSFPNNDPNDRDKGNGENNDGTGTLDATDEGILDLLVSKYSAIKLASEAARTVLSVDQIIVARQAGGPKPPAQNPVS